MSRPARIPLAEPHLIGNARQYLEQCIDSNFVSSIGPFVDRFEREFAAWVGTRHAVACASGTAALHVAMRAAGVGPGDEVFVPAFTFIASANAVAYQGGRSTLVDSERRSWNADPERIVGEIERRARAGQPLPRAVEIVHVLGHPADIAEVARVCREHAIPLIEDAAEALGARYAGGELAGRHVGTIGTFGCFSFNGNKIITTGGGGMIVTDDERLAARARHLTTQARLPGRAYQHDEVGYNYRLPNLAAALGVAQLEQLPEFVERKRAIAARYDHAFERLAGVVLPPRQPWAEPSVWLYSILVGPEADPRRRDDLIEQLDAAGIDARPLWTPLHVMSLYREAPRLGDGRIAEAIAGAGLSLPCSVQLSPADQQRVIDAVLAHWR